MSGAKSYIATIYGDACPTAPRTSPSLMCTRRHLHSQPPSINGIPTSSNRYGLVTLMNFLPFLCRPRFIFMVHLLSRRPVKLLLPARRPTETSDGYLPITGFTMKSSEYHRVTYLFINPEDDRNEKTCLYLAPNISWELLRELSRATPSALTDLFIHWFHLTVVTTAWRQKWPEKHNAATSYIGSMGQTSRTVSVLPILTLFSKRRPSWRYPVYERNWNERTVVSIEGYLNFNTNHFVLIRVRCCITWKMGLYSIRFITCRWRHWWCWPWWIRWVNWIGTAIRTGEGNCS